MRHVIQSVALATPRPTCGLNKQQQRLQRLSVNIVLLQSVGNTWQHPLQARQSTAVLTQSLLATSSCIAASTNRELTLFTFISHSLRRSLSTESLHPFDLEIEKICHQSSKEARVKREEAKIITWENLQKAKAEAAIRKMEMKLENKRSSSMDRIMKKLRLAQRKAQEMRTSISANQSQQIVRASNRKLSFRSPFSPGVMAADDLIRRSNCSGGGASTTDISYHVLFDPCIMRSISVHGWSSGHLSQSLPCGRAPGKSSSSCN
ncbi:hypothetical protein Syun_003636 [Stephania yunnanensis]|uniref:Remorin C-terminal domain-containing protein n=1 Tax=Stephania yunnanensis TaxID=152371 RepID=A0AAP0L5G3_9MAGN